MCSLVISSKQANENKHKERKPRIGLLIRRKPPRVRLDLAVIAKAKQEADFFTKQAIVAWRIRDCGLIIVCFQSVKLVSKRRFPSWRRFNHP